MDDMQAKTLEEKLKSLLGQLELEHAVFERMVYKNKNQHRRCSYFQYLLKVRRDLRLLRSANMEEIMKSCFHVISGKRSKQKIHVLESLKWKKSDIGKPNILERLLGALHLLSQMTEPILKAASGISTLLARSFFIGFSVTFLALLARLRVLIQQILLDAVAVFNFVTSASLKKQSIKISEDGVEVYREFYPKDVECITKLDCVWKTDKYVLVKTLQHQECRPLEGSVSEDASNRDSLVQYQTSVSSLGEDNSPSPLEGEDKGVTVNESSLLLEADDGGVTARESLTPLVELAASNTNHGPKPGISKKPVVGSTKVDTDTVKPSCRANKVAFLPVKRSSSAMSNAMEPPTKKLDIAEDKDKKEEDGFYNLLIRGTHKDSLF